MHLFDCYLYSSNTSYDFFVVIGGVGQQCPQIDSWCFPTNCCTIGKFNGWLVRQVPAASKQLVAHCFFFLQTSTNIGKSNRTEQKTAPNLTRSVCVPLWSCNLFMRSKPRIKCKWKIQIITPQTCRKKDTTVTVLNVPCKPHLPTFTIPIEGQVDAVSELTVKE